MSKPNDPVNYGIVGNVTAKAVAVRTGASAIVNEEVLLSRAEFDSALKELRDQIAALQLPDHSRELLREDVAKIEEMAGEKPEPTPAASDVLRTLVDKLKMVGVFLQTAVGLQEPVRKLAAWFHVQLPL